MLKNSCSDPHPNPKNFYLPSTSNVLIKKGRNACQDLYGKLGGDLPITASHVVMGGTTFSRENMVRNTLLKQS